MSFFITGFELTDVGGVRVGVISVDIPVCLSKEARTLLLRGAVNAVTLGGSIEYTDEKLTVAGGYSPLLKRVKGLSSNIQVAARSGGSGLSIIIGVPALPPESY